MSRRMNVDANTILLWRLDESGGGNAVDFGPNGYTGTNDGSTVVPVTDMPFAYGRHFQASQAIYKSDEVALKPVNVSVEAWFHWDGSTGNYQYIAGRQTDGAASDGYILLVSSAHNLEFFILLGGSWEIASFSITGLTTGWHYAVGTRDAVTTRIYLDGLLRNSNAATPGNITYLYTRYFAVGNYYAPPASASNYFNGDIAEVRLSNRARTPWEIYNTWKAVNDPQIGFVS